MKKNILTILSLILCVFISQAQEQLDHNYKMFRTDDGRTYVNRNQPMYLFLGTSPDNSKAERLESESSPKYSNPFYFDAEGYNTIRTPSKVDTVTKKVIYPIEDIIFEIYADGLAPVSTLNLVKGKKYIKEGVVYYGKNLVGFMRTADRTSGVEKRLVSIDKSPYTAYTDTLKFDKEKAYAVKYYSVDNVGNVEKAKEKTFSVDITPPVTNWKLIGDIKGTTVSARSKIELMAEDALTGVKNIRYQIDDGPMYLYSGPINLSVIPEGDHQLKYYAMDNVGNSTTGGDMDNGMTIKAFIIDRIAPEVETEIIGDMFKGKYTYVSNRAKVKVNAEDDQLGISKIMYEFNSSNLTNKYEEPVEFIDKKGIQSFYYRAYDMVSNKTGIKRLTVYMDNEEPYSGVNYSSPKFFTRDTLFINDKTKISLFSKDDASGVQKIQYAVDKGEYVDGKSLVLGDQGYHLIKFKAIDNVNNQEQVKESEVVVDLEGPEIFVKFSIKSIRKEMVDGKEIDVYPPYVKMYIAGTDRYCGTQSIYYSIDGGKQMNYSVGQNPSDIAMFTKEKLYQVKVVAKDKLGNKQTKELSFRIAKK